MICYRDRCYCADHKECATHECSRRVTQKDKMAAGKLGLGIAYMPMRDNCCRFVEVPSPAMGSADHSE